MSDPPRAQFRAPTPESEARLKEMSDHLGPQPAIVPDQAATQRQLRYLQAVAREAGLDLEALDDRSAQEFGVPAQQLSRRDASTMIDLIQMTDRRR